MRELTYYCCAVVRPDSTGADKWCGREVPAEVAQRQVVPFSRFGAGLSPRCAEHAEESQ